MQMDTFVRILLLALAVALFGGGYYLSIEDKSAAAGLTYAAAIFAMIFAFLSRFKRFKGLGVEAEMWEDKQAEAADLIDRLRKLTAATAKPIFSIAPRMGRWDSALPRQEAHEVITKLDDVLEEAEVPPEQIEELKRPYHYFAMVDQIRPIRDALNELVHKKKSKLSDEVNRLPKPIAGDDLKKSSELNLRIRGLGEKFDQIGWMLKDKMRAFEAMPAKLEAIIKELPEFTDVEKEAFLQAHHEELEDIRYYARHKKFRRLEVWLQGED